AFFMPSDWARDRCFNLEAVEQTSAKLDACNELVATAGRIEERADLLRQRGIAHHRLGDYQNALADYSQAILIDPQDSYALYNRALVRTRLGDWRGAVSDYDVSLQLRSDNTDAYLNRGLIFLDSGQFDKAIAD